MIMPVTPDSPTTAMVHQRLGVAIWLDKDNITAEAVGSGFRQLCAPEFQARSHQIKELNDRRVDLGRAVEVVEFAAAGAFRPRTTPQGLALGPALAPACAAWLFFLVLVLGGLRCCGCLYRCCCCCCPGGR